MANSPKRQPGRPKKDPLEKGEQFSIRMSAPFKIMLEMIARDKRVSLSTAIQQMVVAEAGRHTIDDETVTDTLYENVAQAVGTLKNIGESYSQFPPEMSAIVGQTALFSSRHAAIFVMPKKLLSKVERAMAEACFSIGKLPSDDLIDKAYVDAKTMDALGVSEDEILNYLKGRLA